MSYFFTNGAYRAIAFHADNACLPTDKTVGDAFAELISGLRPGQLDNLCIRIRETRPELTLDECYALTQSEAAGAFLPLAYACLDAGEPLGSEKIDGRGTSEWLGHCLLNGRVCGTLAKACGLDVDRAMKMGILHDCGRKITQSFEHTYRGFEMLWDKGWRPEAFACLVHSFLNGDRCSNMEPSEPAFYVDAEGNGCWKEGVPVDDFTTFLRSYSFTDYDRILNFADLTATSWEVLSPAARLRDIATRRVLDPVNYGYFLADFHNQMARILVQMGFEVPNYRELKAAEGVSEEEILERFEAMSDLYYEKYLTLESPC